MKIDFLINIWCKKIGELWITPDEFELTRRENGDPEIIGFNFLFGIIEYEKAEFNGDKHDNKRNI